MSPLQRWTSGTRPGKRPDVWASQRAVTVTSAFSEAEARGWQLGAQPGRLRDLVRSSASDVGWPCSSAQGSQILAGAGKEKGGEGRKRKRGSGGHQPWWGVSGSFPEPKEALGPEAVGEVSSEPPRVTGSIYCALPSSSPSQQLRSGEWTAWPSALRVGTRGQPGGAGPEAPRGQVSPAAVEFEGKGPGLLVKEKGHLSVHQEMVVDSGQPRVDLQLRPLVAQVHSRRQRQLVVAGCIKGVLGRGEAAFRGQAGTWGSQDGSVVPTPLWGSRALLTMTLRGLRSDPAPRSQDRRTRSIWSHPVATGDREQAEEHMTDQEEWPGYSRGRQRRPTLLTGRGGFPGETSP